MLKYFALVASAHTVLLGVVIAPAEIPQSEQAPPPPAARLWMGHFQSGAEKLVFEWQDGLLVWLDKIPVPADGQWHETVPTFAVRHRVSWRKESGTLLVEEQHNEGARWTHVLELSQKREEVLKYELRSNGSRGNLIRRYSRTP